jgi:AAA family ATP:ADP antiporter
VPQKLSKKIKNLIWPIEKNEHIFFLPMALMMMCALYNFASLRSIKDSLIVSNIGAESISFLKLWLVLPSAVIFTMIYLKMSNIFSLDKVFYVITSCFLIFFIVFCLFLYPNKIAIHPEHAKVENLAYLYPNLKWFIRIWGHWSFALMYIFSELWSVVIINLMFWQFANHVVETDNARRFYPLFGLVGNFGLIIAGNAMVYFSDLNGVPTNVVKLAYHVNAEAADISLKLSIFSVVISGVLMLFLMFYINKHVLRKALKKDDIETSTVTKLSFLESVKLIFSSRYIGYLTIIIICYGLAINVLEGPWKAKIRELHPTQQEYLAFMGHFNIWMGVSCVTFMVIGSNILRIFSWRTSALFTPAVIGITGLAFFIFVIFSNNRIGDILIFDPLYAAVLAGALQNILSKSSKYSLFDSTKEMAYIPLSLELRTKGKAAAEVIGAKFGKSLGAVIQSSIFTIIPSIDFSGLTPVLLSIFSIVIGIWIINLLLLSKEYENTLKLEKKNV